MLNATPIVDSDQKAILAIWQDRWLFTIFLVIGAFLGFSAALLTKPIYQGQLKVLPADMPGEAMADAGLLGGLAGLTGLALGAKSTVQFEALEILQSRTFIGSFIEDNNLLPVLFPKDWDSPSSSWKQPLWGKPPTLAEGVKLFIDDILRVDEDRRTGIISISVEWHDRFEVASWANTLVEKLNKEMRSRAIRESERNLQFLEKQLSQTQAVEISQAVYSLVEHEVKSSMLAQVREEFAFRVIDEAIVPEENDFVWPNYGLLLAGGSALGLLFGLVFLFLRQISQQSN